MVSKVFFINPWGDRMNLFKRLVVLLVFIVGVIHAENIANKNDMTTANHAVTDKQCNELLDQFLKLRDKEKALVVNACLNGKAYDSLNDKDKKKFLELVTLLRDIVFSEKYGDVVEKICLKITKVLYEKKIDNLTSSFFNNNALLTGLLVVGGYFLFFK